MRKISTALLIILILVVPLLAFAEGNVTADRTISFEESSYVVYAGKAQKIVVTVENILDSAPKQTQLVWTSSDPDIAMVNAGGQVTGKKAGKVTITAAAKDNEAVSASVEAEVRVPVQSVQINEKNVSVVVGGKEEAASIQLTTTIKPEDAFFQTGVWSSSNESVATVDSNGVVTGISAGNANITFTSDDPNGQKKAQTAVRVGQAVESIAITSQGANVPTGRTLALKADVQPTTASNKKVVWSSSDEEVATVNMGGQVKGIKPGQVRITAAAEDGSGITSTIDVSVVSPVKKLTLSAKKISLAPGYDWQVSAEVEPEDATIKDVIWSSTDEKVATVDENGLVHGVAKGSAKINAVAADGSGIKVQVSVTVKEYNYVLSSPSDRPTVNYETPGGIWGIAYRSKNKCVSSDSDTLKPLKAGEDTFTVLMQSYMTGRIKRKKFSVLVLPSAVR